MKQIFDWLREEAEIYVEEAGYLPTDKPVIARGGFHKIITAAETKWEADCCEWVTGNYCAKVQCLGKVKDVGFDAHDFIFCPYCGRKISEVE